MRRSAWGAAARGARAAAGYLRSGYGSAAASPPETVSYCPLAQLGHGGRFFVEPTESS